MREEGRTASDKGGQPGHHNTLACGLGWETVGRGSNHGGAGEDQNTYRRDAKPWASLTGTKGKGGPSVPPGPGLRVGAGRPQVPVEGARGT